MRTIFFPDQHPHNRLQPAETLFAIIGVVAVVYLCEEFILDVDDEKQYGSYYRILAVVYVNETTLNEKLVREGYAEVIYSTF